MCFTSYLARFAPSCLACSWPRSSSSLCATATCDTGLISGGSGISMATGTSSGDSVQSGNCGGASVVDVVAAAAATALMDGAAAICCACTGSRNMPAISTMHAGTGRTLLTRQALRCLPVDPETGGRALTLKPPIQDAIGFVTLPLICENRGE